MPAEKVATADWRIAEQNLYKTTADIVLLAKKLYCARLMAEKEKELAQASMRSADARIKESVDAVAAGNVLEIVVSGARVKQLQAKQALLEADNQIRDVDAELSDLTGMPLYTRFEPLDDLPAPPEAQPEAVYVESAYGRNPELHAALKTVDKAESAIDAARYDYIPDIGLFGSYSYQDGIPYIDQTIGAAGVMMKWELFDWGKRGDVVDQRKALRSQARQNVDRLKRRIAVDVGKAVRKIDRAREILDVAQAAFTVQEERLRIAGEPARGSVSSPTPRTWI